MRGRLRNYSRPLASAANSDLGPRGVDLDEHLVGTAIVIRELWRAWLRPKSTGGRRSRPLRIEPLEHRELLAASIWAAPAADGHLIYKPDGDADRIADFSNAGYRGGVETLPVVETKVVVSPQPGDDGAAIQAAIDQVSRLPLDSSGMRGAVLLERGEYQIEGQIFLWASGVVLRGEGDDADGTVLRATGTVQRSLVMVLGTDDRTVVEGTEHQVVDKYVPVGARSFDLESTAGLAVGDTIIVHRPSTADWIKAIGMNKLTNPWQAGSKDLLFDRVITRIEGNTITIDAPLTNALDQKYGGGLVYEYAWPGRIENVGIENLRGDSDFKSRTDENHAWTFLQFNNVQHAWAQSVTAVHYAYAAVWLDTNSSHVTVEDAAYLDPISTVDGGRRYAFYFDGQLSLVKDAYSENGRHDFVVGSLAPGPNVFLDSLATGSSNDSGPHHRWSTGTLLDNIATNNEINIRNRGNSGTGHGWAGANSVVWNSKASNFIVENPPTAQNWLIGSVGRASGNGLRDSHGNNVQPRSLYYSQLQDRLLDPGSEQREYWIGDIDALQRDGAADDVFVAADWLAAIQAQPKVKTQGFDLTSANTWTAFTAQFGLDEGETIVGASLSLGVRATASTSIVRSNKLYLDSLSSPITVSSLGWGSIPRTGVTGVLVDLTKYLDHLQDGNLNVALSDDLVVDWVVLNITVAPTFTAEATAILASADATVRGGTSAAQNLNANPALTVQGGTVANNLQATLLAFDLAGFVGPVQHAVLRLPVTSAAAGLENGLSIVRADWSETAVTWNNQPAASKPMATWIPTTGKTVEIALTPIIERLLAEGETTLSLKITATAGTGLATYGPRQLDPLLLQPQLLLYG